MQAHTGTYRHNYIIIYTQTCPYTHIDWQKSTSTKTKFIYWNKLYLINKTSFNSINPMSAIYKLHKWHRQFPGFQDSIFDLKMLRFFESSILLGKSSHIFGPIKDIVSEP